MTIKQYKSPILTKQPDYLHKAEIESAVFTLKAPII